MKIILIYYKLLMKIPTPSIRELKTNYNYLQKKKKKMMMRRMIRRTKIIKRVIKKEMKRIKMIKMMTK